MIETITIPARVRLLPRIEAADSARFDREKDPDLGAALIAEVQERIRFAVQFPEASVRLPRTPGFHVRRLLLERFEYALVFALLENELVMISVHHQHIPEAVHGQARKPVRRVVHEPVGSEVGSSRERLAAAHRLRQPISDRTRPGG